MIQLNSPDQLDLKRHAIIEASAGTGKTYTIENIITRLLKENPNLNLGQILIVTFTEKATSEMKERIRAKLKEEIQPQSEPQKHPNLYQAFSQFDQAQIFTIHGFCHRILQQYAFENQQSLNFDLSSLDPIYKNQLFLVLRTKWKHTFGKDYQKWLQLVRFDENWIKLVLELSQKVLRQPNLDIYPQTNHLVSYQTWQQKFLELKVQLQTASTELQKEGHIESILQSYLNIPIKGKKANSEKILHPFLSLMDAPKDELLDIIISTCQGLKLKDIKKLYDYEWTQAAIKNGLDKAENFPDFVKLFDLIQTIFKTYQEMSQHFTLFAAKDLLSEVKKAKDDLNLLDFDDLLIQVDEHLQQGKASRTLLLQHLRNKYKIAIVDEFQDTDARQWNIFQQIFTNSKQHKLYLVGDPKQSIYSFRAADLNVYQSALTYLLNQGAQHYTLQHNYRSTPHLIDGFNHLFQNPDPWFEHRPPYDYQDILTPTAPPPCELIDHMQRGAINWIDLNELKKSKPTQESLNAKQAQSLLASFIAREIEWLLNPNHQPKILFKEKGSTRDINENDLCILIKKRNELEPIETALKEKKIPYSVYKGGGLFESDEASHLQILLEALSNPNDEKAFHRLLLSSVFKFPIEVFQDLKSHPHYTKARFLFDKWTSLCQPKQWPSLFQTVLEDSQLLFDDLYSNQPASERIQTNYEHLFSYLTEETQHLEHLSQLVRFFSQIRHHKVAFQEDEQLLKLETEEPRVKIMTMHVSKGLQFPIVFLAGGFSHDNPSPYSKFSQLDVSLKTYIDLCTPGKDHPEHVRAVKAEEERLLYVAVTRAKCKLYLPHFKNSSYKKDSPLERILAKRYLPSLKDPSFKSLTFSDQKIQDSTLAQSQDKKHDLENISPEVLSIPLLKPLYLKKGKLQHSYTSIYRNIQSSHDHNYSSISDEPISETFSSQDHLPPGPQTGVLLHFLLEHTSQYGIHNQHDLDTFLDQSPSLTHLIQNHYNWPEIFRQSQTNEEKLIRRIKEIVFLAYNTPLKINDNLLSLKDEDFDKCFEKEFFFPIETPQTEQYMQGFIDLLYRYQGIYYIIDWKSHLLEDYQPSTIHKCMDKHHYHIQYQIYALALQQWLKNFDNSKHTFGGVYYLFLRGLNGKNSNEGVFFCPPNQLNPNHIKKYLKTHL